MAKKQAQYSRHMRRRRALFMGVGFLLGCATMIAYSHYSSQTNEWSQKMDRIDRALTVADFAQIKDIVFLGPLPSGDPLNARSFQLARSCGRGQVHRGWARVIAIAPNSRKMLREALKADDIEGRYAAAVILGMMEDNSSALAAIREALLANENEPWVQSAAAESIAKVGGETGVQTLLSLLVSLCRQNADNSASESTAACLLSGVAAAHIDVVESVVLDEKGATDWLPPQPSGSKPKATEGVVRVLFRVLGADGEGPDGSRQKRLCAAFALGFAVGYDEEARSVLEGRLRDPKEADTVKKICARVLARKSANGGPDGGS